ncbi:hypothetical protein NKH57_21335 [Mesorhizobium sp. M1050]|uniref:hypothetical protein n=1 Tax=unclassified Mesorhizobium TaxID=325217 RepID=UPI0012EBE067|nr:hypothetical protein [Mesorhizobium sp. LNHC252B00]
MSRVASQETAAEPPHPWKAAPRRVAIFSDNGFFFRDIGWGLLIVPALFFIQRRNGEVAEWSKALPC